MLVGRNPHLDNNSCDLLYLCPIYASTLLAKPAYAPNPRNTVCHTKYNMADGAARRVNGSLLPHFLNQPVTLIGKIVANEPGYVILESSVGSVT